MKNFIKNILWYLLPKVNGFNKIRVLAGPAKGVKMLVDIRLGGSYMLGNYDSWVFKNFKIEKYIKPGMVCWDCGAFYGYYGAMFRNLVGSSGFVEIFEASSNNYKTVSHLPELNNWSNVRVHNYAIGPENSEIKFVNSLGGCNGPLGLDKNYENTNEQIEYETVSCYGVDELIDRNNIKEPDFIKFDLETAEIYALRNGDSLFSKKKPMILLEVHNKHALEVTCEFIEKYNYKCQRIAQMGTASPIVYDRNNMLKIDSNDNENLWTMLFLYP